MNLQSKLADIKEDWEYKKESFLIRHPKIESSLEKLDSIKGPLIAIGCPLIIAGLGATRGYAGEPFAPETLSQITRKDVVEAGLMAVPLASLTLEGLSSKTRYSEGQMIGMRMLFAPAYFALLHGLGYAAGKAIRGLQ